MTKTLTWLLSLLQELIERRFYGKLTIQLEAGRVTVVKQEETLKPSKE